MIDAVKPLLSDLASSIFFALLIAVTGNIYLATGAGIALGIAQVAIQKLRGKDIATMQWMSLALVIVFGSLVRPGRFNEQSDVDLALESEPVGMSVYQLCSLLAERLGRRVDVLLLSESRFRDKILKEGETWTLPG